MTENLNAKLSSLFWITFKLGAITFGGGYVIVPLFENEFVTKRNWLKQDDMLNMVALSQSVPGVIAINCSVLVGYRLRRIKGAVVTVLGSMLPSLITLTVITFIYQEFRDNIYVTAALRGVRAAVVALLVSAFWKFTKPFRKEVVSIIAFAVALLLSLLTDINNIYIILGAIVYGIVFGIWHIRDAAKLSGKDGMA
jgi:chromate transporter